jgi:hypothetical protein
MEYAPPPRDPESEARGHELRDVAARPILFFLIGLVLFGSVLQAIMHTIMTGYVKQDTSAAVPSMDYLRDHGKTDVAPPLQRDTTADMVKMYEEEDAILTLDRPRRDKRSGKVAVSLDRAMTIIAKKGLPHRETAPKGVADPELPYSETARAYKTTN